MRKIVINTCFGGFGLNSAAEKTLCFRLNITHLEHIERDNVELVKLVEELGDASWGHCAQLEIVEIPDDVNWTIEEYDGLEHVAEVHRCWYGSGNTGV